LLSVGTKMMSFFLLFLFLSLTLAQCPFSGLNQIFGTDYNNAPLQDYVLPRFLAPSFCSADTYNSLAANIKSKVASGNLSAPTLFRLGFHHCNIGSAFGYGYTCNGGWLHYDVDAQAGQNAGLPDTLNTLDALRNSGSYGCITYADLYTFSGALGLELGGGPPIAWYPGRADPISSGPANPPLSVILPDGMNNAAATQHWGANFGFTLRETVLLLGGGHTFGGADASGWLGSFTSFGDSFPTPANKYFIDLLQQTWTPVASPSGSGKTQFVCSACGSDPDGNPVIRFPSDMALRDSSTFNSFSTEYANNAQKFVNDLQYAYQRLLQLGAGQSYFLSNSYVWKGYNGNWNGYGTNIQPLMN